MKKSWDRAGKEPRREAGCPPFAASSGRGGRRGGGAGVLRGTQHSKAKWGQRPETGVQRAGGEIVRVGGALLGHCFGQVTDLADFGSKDFIPTRVLHEGENEVSGNIAGHQEVSAELGWYYFGIFGFEKYRQGSGLLVCILELASSNYWARRPSHIKPRKRAEFETLPRSTPPPRPNTLSPLPTSHYVIVAKTGTPLSSNRDGLSDESRGNPENGSAGLVDRVISSPRKRAEFERLPGSTPPPYAFPASPPSSSQPSTTRLPRLTPYRLSPTTNLAVIVAKLEEEGRAEGISSDVYCPRSWLKKGTFFHIVSILRCVAGYPLLCVVPSFLLSSFLAFHSFPLYTPSSRPSPGLHWTDDPVPHLIPTAVADKPTTFIKLSVPLAPTSDCRARSHPSCLSRLRGLGCVAELNGSSQSFPTRTDYSKPCRNTTTPTHCAWCLPSVAQPSASGVTGESDVRLPCHAILHSRSRNTTPSDRSTSSPT
ncbi:hypothetical protein FB45DRAFT_998348 [Roridomyces roridus]|uniref:Uncharacterized protein n=1 Tax=Roridomyces roridus TaxID=1738132 RepID=A0AAD7G099_9AGAR|nr:hypothetical protein FB45DRAFT_998348 [Roridomyces roridus]